MWTRFTLLDTSIYHMFVLEDKTAFVIWILYDNVKYPAHFVLSFEVYTYSVL